MATSATKWDSSVQFGKAAFRQAVLAQLEFQVGDDRAQVGVAAAFAEAVDRALHLDGAFAHGRQRVGHGAFAVVVGVDAKRVLRWQL